MSYTNGNGHSNGNGNGHDKAFELTKARSPAEVHQENLKREMPVHRRLANERHLPPGPKLLFGIISDDSFMYTLGGDGFGTIVVTIKDLARRYHHTRESIGKWLDALEQEELIWIERNWPYLEIHVSALVPNPSNKARPGQKVRARAMAKSREAAIEASVGSADTPFFLAKSAKTARFAEGNGTSRLEDQASCVGSADTTCGIRRHTVSVPSSVLDCAKPHTVSEDTAQRDGSADKSCPVEASQRVGVADRAPEKSLGRAEQNASPKKSPLPGGQEDIGVCAIAAPTHVLPRFEPLDRKVLPRLRPALGQQMIEQCQTRINAMETSRNPLPNAKEIIRSYRSRIKDVKNWVAGEL